MVFYGEKVDQSIAQEGYPKIVPRPKGAFSKRFQGVKPAPLVLVNTGL